MCLPVPILPGEICSTSSSGHQSLILWPTTPAGRGMEQDWWSTAALVLDFLMPKRWWTSQTRPPGSMFQKRRYASSGMILFSQGMENVCIFFLLFLDEWQIKDTLYGGCGRLSIFILRLSLLLQFFGGTLVIITCPDAKTAAFSPKNTLMLHPVWKFQVSKLKLEDHLLFFCSLSLDSVVYFGLFDSMASTPTLPITLLHPCLIPRIWLYISVSAQRSTTPLQLYASLKIPSFMSGRDED